MDANFFTGAPDPQADPRAFQNQQAMAQALMARGVGGQGGVAGQVVNGLAGAYKANQLRDATRASDILNGGSGQNGLQKVGSWLGGLLGGA